MVLPLEKADFRKCIISRHKATPAILSHDELRGLLVAAL